MAKTRVIVFDVNETLSDLAPMAGRFTDLGLPGSAAATWFAQVLRDGFALAATGRSATFSVIADGVLRTTFVAHQPDRAAADAVQHVLAGFSSLPLHADVAPGVRALTAAGLRLVTLTNGGATVSESLLTRAGLHDRFERLLSVDDAPRWKPAAESYAYAAEQCAVSPAEMMLVAVHPWDIDGAACAGLRTAWIDRTGGAPYPPHFSSPDLTVTGIDELARELRS